MKWVPKMRVFWKSHMVLGFLRIETQVIDLRLCIYNINHFLQSSLLLLIKEPRNSLLRLFNSASPPKNKFTGSDFSLIFRVWLFTWPLRGADAWCQCCIEDQWSSQLKANSYRVGTLRCGWPRIGMNSRGSWRNVWVMILPALSWMGIRQRNEGWTPYKFWHLFILQGKSTA